MMNVTTAEHTGLWGFSVKGIGILCPRPSIYDVGNRGPLVADMVILWFYKDSGEKMETTILSCGYVGILEHGNYCIILGVFWDNGKEIELHSARYRFCLGRKQVKKLSHFVSLHYPF